MPCKSFAAGNCRFGEACQYKHDKNAAPIPSSVAFDVTFGMACIGLADECDDFSMACIEIIDENENIQEIVYDAPEPEIDIEYENPCDPNFIIDFGHCALAAKMLVAPAVHPQTQLDNASFIIDSGSGHHIVSNRHLPDKVRHERTYQLWGPPLLATANGVIRPDRGIQISIEDLNITTQALVLDNSPAVLSLGRLCQVSGFTFTWEPGSRPVLTDPLGFTTELAVKELCPRALDERNLCLPDHGQ